MISTAILTISDKGYNNQREDLTGPAIKDILPSDKFSVDYYKIIPDEVEMIKEELIYLCDSLGINMILTNGGTGFFKERCYSRSHNKCYRKISAWYP